MSKSRSGSPAGSSSGTRSVAGAGKPEFSRSVPLKRIGTGLDEHLEANEQECAALAKRFGLQGLEHLACSFRLKRVGDETVLADGELAARVTQSCIITGEPVPEEISERFTLRFVPREALPDEDEELDLEALMAEDADDVPYDGQMIDLGEAAAEQLALCLDPYPRKAGAGLEKFVEVTPEAPEEDEEDEEAPRKPNPFAVLQKLKDGGKTETH